MVALGLILTPAGAGGLAWKILTKNDGPAVAVGAAPMPNPAPVNPKPPEIPEPPKPTIVLLEVTTEPPGATLRISNKEWRTPASLDDSQITPGRYEIEIMKPGFETIPDIVTLTAGKAFKVHKELQKEKRKLAFELISDRPGAKIMINEFGTGLTTPQSTFMDMVKSV